MSFSNSYWKTTLHSPEVVNILASRNHHSGIVETGVPDPETSIDWLDYPASEIPFL